MMTHLHCGEITFITEGCQWLSLRRIKHEKQKYFKSYCTSYSISSFSLKKNDLQNLNLRQSASCIFALTNVISISPCYVLIHSNKQSTLCCSPLAMRAYYYMKHIHLARTYRTDNERLLFRFWHCCTTSSIWAFHLHLWSEQFQ